ncbi:nitrate reductase molybdenum cofactor assembly chaperone [Castellaniella ginsengisoli]|uniref:Nitrate reductase molybdenum cofactor assembly chaperone n=1 Tax=Castellaniella ginsengisoli TaxID=546114 RepID=A0AB39FJS1_9BURK
MDAQTASRQAPVFSVLSVLLGYPEQDWLDALPELHAALPADVRARLAPLFDFLDRNDDLIDLQEQYVATFDRRAAHSLHLFEHVHGESRDRGQAMVDLRNEYLKYGLEPAATELPDYVPLFLEFLGQIPAEAAEALLGDAIHVLARLGDKLSETDSPYACLFAQLRTMTDVQPEALPDPPEGDMEETLITFGPQADGTEPLMMRRPAGGDSAQPIVFHPPRARKGGPDGGQA